MNRAIIEKVRWMLSNAGLTKRFWVEAVTYAGHLINRLPYNAIKGNTPIEVWTGKLATTYDSLKKFGCHIFFHVPEDNKLDPRANEAIFLGFSSGVKGFRLWCPYLNKVVLSRDVAFNIEGEWLLVGRRISLVKITIMTVMCNRWSLVQWLLVYKMLC